MRYSFLVLLAALATSAAATPSRPPHAPSDRVTPAALWQPGMGFVQAAHAACDRQHPADYGACFIDQMAAAGAPPAAVAFARRLNARPDGTLGILRNFRHTGRVDLAFVWFPLRANENQGCFLVNGSPALVDVDAPGRLPMKALARTAAWRALARRYPQISLWPGDRAGTRFTHATRRPGGGQRFTFPYLLLNGCHACAIIGTVRLAFDFDATGRFLGTRIVDVRATRRPQH